MYDEEKQEIKSKRNKRKKRIKERFNIYKKAKYIIIIVFIIFIISLIYSLSNNFIFKTTNKANDINDHIKTEFLEDGRINLLKTEEELFLNYQKEINSKNEEFENNILLTNIIKQKLEKIRIIKENNTLI